MAQQKKNKASIEDDFFASGFELARIKKAICVLNSFVGLGPL
jgi:hypothetical protein